MPEIEPSRVDGGGLTRVLRNRNFSRLFVAGLSSAGGATIGEVSLLWLIWSSTHSAFDIALYGLAFLLSGVSVSLIAGVVVDRYDRRRVMILADVSRAATVGTLFGVLLFFGFHLSIVLAAVALVAVFSTLFVPAQNALIPRLVGPTAVADANGIVQSANSVVQFTANGAAGLLIASLGAVVGLGLNTLTFVASAAFVASIALPSATSAERLERDARRAQSYASDLRAGFHYLRTQLGLLELTLSAGIGNFFITMVFSFEVVYATGPLHGGPQVFGAILGLGALGGGIGALCVGRFRATRYSGRVWILGGVFEAFGVLGLAAFPSIPVALALCSVLGFFLGLMNTTWLSTAQLIVPTEMQGRYFGIDQLGSFAVIPLAQVVGAIMVEFRGILWTYEIAGLGLLATGIAFAFARDLRRLRAPTGP